MRSSLGCSKTSRDAPASTTKTALQNVMEGLTVARRMPKAEAEEVGRRALLLPGVLKDLPGRSRLHHHAALHEHRLVMEGLTVARRMPKAEAEEVGRRALSKVGMAKHTKRSVPSSARSRKFRHRSSVVFPEPLGPSMATTSPLFTRRSTPMVKDTSLAANITVVEMFRAAEQINARVYEPLALYIEVGMIYLLFSTALTWLQRVGERKLSAYESREG